MSDMLDGMKALKWGDPEIERLESEGWIVCGMWDGRDPESGFDCGGPILRLTEKKEA